MSPKIFSAFEAAIAKHRRPDGYNDVLEVGATPYSILTCSSLTGARKVALNLAFSDSDVFPPDIQKTIGNSNKFDFPDASFDLVVSVSVLEHDRWFWRSIPEMRRILRPGGHLMIGVPGFIKHPLDFLRTTFTYKRHGYAYNADFYRFSEQAVLEVLLEGFAERTCTLLRKFPNPYLMGIGAR